RAAGENAACGLLIIDDRKFRSALRRLPLAENLRSDHLSPGRKKPIFGKRFLQLVDGRPLQLQRQIVPVALVFVANVHAPKKTRAAVDDDNLAVIAEIDRRPQGQERQWQEVGRFTTGFDERGHEVPAPSKTAP